MFTSSFRIEPEDAIDENECLAGQVKEKVKKTVSKMKPMTDNLEPEMTLNQGSYKEEKFWKAAI